MFGGWVFFRSNGLAQAGGYFAALAGFGTGTWIVMDLTTNALGVALAVGMVACLPVLPWVTTLAEKCSAAMTPGWRAVGEFATIPVTLVALTLVVLGTGMALVGNTYSAFIYFRF